MDKNVFIKGFKKLSITFGHEFNKDRGEVYFEILHPMPNDKFLASVDEICQTGKFFPKPVEILKATFENIPEHTIKQDILDAVGNYGTYRTPKFKYKLSEMIAADIGWVNLCMTSLDDINDKIHWGYMSASKEYETAMTTGSHISIESGGLKGLHDGGGRGRGNMVQLGQIIERDKNE
jgi:hypothetical protein